MINDSPDNASTSSIQLDEGDFIVVATDGLWDNLTEKELLVEIANIKVSAVFFSLIFLKCSSVTQSKVNSKIIHFKLRMENILKSDINLMKLELA